MPKPAHPKSRRLDLQLITGSVGDTNAPVTPGAAPSRLGVGLPLPHERDESTEGVVGTPDPAMVSSLSGRIFR